MKANDLEYLIVQHAPSLNPQLAIACLHVVSKGIYSYTILKSYSI